MNKCTVFWSYSHSDMFFFVLTYRLEIICKAFSHLHWSIWIFIFLLLSGRESLFMYLKLRRMKTKRVFLMCLSRFVTRGAYLITVMWNGGDLSSAIEGTMETFIMVGTSEWDFDMFVFVFILWMPILIFTMVGTLELFSSNIIVQELPHLVFLLQDTF